MPASPERPRRAVQRLIDVWLAGPDAVRQLPPCDLDLLLRLMRRVKLLARLAWELEADQSLASLPAVAIDQLRSALATTEWRARVVEWEMNRIAWALREAEVDDLIALKGCAYLLAGLPQARTRMIVDVDLMVAEQDLERTERSLTRRGWQMSELSPYDDNYYRKWTHELPPMIHATRDIEVDLHHNIIPRTARLKPDSSLLLRDARSFGDSRFKTLSGSDMTLHAMTHLMFDSELADRLRDLVDIDDLIRYFSARESDYWDSLVSRAEQLDLHRPLFYAVRYSVQLLGTPVPAAAMRGIDRHAPPRPVTWLMDRLVPRALLPEHPDHPSRATALARLLLYMRSHWIRMPPLMLARHLSFKFYVRHLQRRFERPRRD